MKFIYLFLIASACCCIVASGKWYIADVDQNCVDACNTHNLECTEKEFFKHNDEIDSPEEVYKLIKKLGGKTAEKSCKALHGNAPANPLFGKIGCISSAPGRKESTFNCRARPSVLKKHKQRLCWCHTPQELTHLPPKYLSVKDWENCLDSQWEGSWKGVCIPKIKPQTCPKSSWIKLKEIATNEPIDACHDEE